MHSDNANLDFAYRYPFSKEARGIIASVGQSLDERLIRAGKLRVEEDLNSESISHYMTGIEEIRRTYVLSYVYSRMMVSAINNRFFIDRYVASEARRVHSALESDTLPNMLNLMAELGIDVDYANERFIIGFAKYLSLSPGSKELALVKQELDKGRVYLTKGNTLRLVESAVADEIRKKLPIPVSELPRRIIEESKSIKLPRIKVEIREGSYRWIEKILATPIPDIRHRAVNIILAPYLVNIKGLSEDDAAAIILEYIERCKQINPDTRINSSYVKYQCKYAKAKGLKPLSFERAKELFKGVLELG